MNANRINLADMHSQKDVYSDYEELAFFNPRQRWVEHLFARIANVHVPDHITDPRMKKDFRDLVFFNSIHVLAAFKEVQGRISEKEVHNIVEAVEYTLDTVFSNKEITRSSVDWSSMDAYAEFWQSA